MSDRGVRQIWAEWLNEWNWEWFVTPTFRDNVGLDAAENRWRKWIGAINNRIDGQVGCFFRGMDGIRTEKCPFA